MPYATLNGLQFYFERAGSGPRLLFISGSGGDLRTQPNVFASPLARAFDLAAYDQRGLGRTDKPDVPSVTPTPRRCSMVMAASTKACSLASRARCKSFSSTVESMSRLSCAEAASSGKSGIAPDSSPKSKIRSPTSRASPKISCGVA